MHGAEPAFNDDGVDLTQIEQRIADRLKGKAQDPQVIVEFVSDRTHTVMVSGDVKNPGRISILEMLPMTDPLRSLVMKHAISSELRNEAIREGMVTMYEDGLRKAVRGITTFEEVLRVTRES